MYEYELDNWFNGLTYPTKLKIMETYLEVEGHL